MNLLRLLTSPVPVPASWYAIPLRLIVGFGFIQHGYAKLARGPEDFIGVLHAMGLPSSFLLGWLTIVVELVGGLMILVGALIPLATLPMMIVLFVAIITVHLPNGFNRLTPLGLTLASRDMKLTCSIWLAFLRCALEDRGRFRLTAGSTGFWGNVESRARVMASRSELVSSKNTRQICIKPYKGSVGGWGSVSRTSAMGH
jgi:uncharacterized membrane protein YphA (DoxX/SURF4 family)